MSVIEKEVLLKAVTEPIFGKEVFSQLPGSAFNENEVHKELYMIIKNYYRTNNNPLGERTLLNIMEDRLTKQRADSEKMDTYFDTVHELYEIENREKSNELIDQQIEKYVRKTLSANLIRETISKQSLDDEGVIEELSEKLKQISVLNGTGNQHELVDFFEDRELKKELYKNMKENRFSTGFTAIDNISGGGLARGELGLVIAKSGGGKSAWSIQQTSNYVKKGMNVLYIILEEKLDRMLLRVEQNFLQVNKSALFDENDQLKEDMYDQIQDMYKASPNIGRLFFSKHNPQEVTVNQLEQIIVNASVRKGVQLDAVIIDYPDLMKNTNTTLSESDAGGKLYEEIRGLAQKYNYVCWVLSQLNRSGYGQEVKTAESIEGSKRKLNAVEIAFTINQTNEEFKEGLIRVHVDKLRYSNGGSYDEMQYFKVHREGVVIRDETEEEKKYHKNFINEPQNTNNGQDNGIDKANHFVNNLNSKL